MPVDNDRGGFHDCWRSSLGAAVDAGSGGSCTDSGLFVRQMAVSSFAGLEDSLEDWEMGR
jgi:hypothetical protein